MVYTYNETTKQIKSVSIPKLKGSDAKRIEEAKVPTAFLQKIMAMKLNVAQA